MEVGSRFSHRAKAARQPIQTDRHLRRRAFTSTFDVGNLPTRLEADMTCKRGLAPTPTDSECFHVHDRQSSDNPTTESISHRRILVADSQRRLTDNPCMSDKPTKRASTPIEQLGHRWFFAEHAETQGKTQADVERALGWPRGKVSALWNCKQRYNQEAVDEVAAWLKLEPYELLMSPDEAHAIKQLRSAARAITNSQAPITKTLSRPAA